MASALILAGLLASTAVAQGSGPISLCTGDACDNCPNSVTTSGTGYPSCVIYDRDTVLGGSVDSYADMDGGSKDIYYDIAAVTNPECRTIIRSPASTTDVNCGYPVYGGQGGVCFRPTTGTKTTFMVQFCCGTGDCTSAGVEKRADGSYGMMSAVLRDVDDNVLVPHSVGDASGDMMDLFMEDHGLNSSSVVLTRSATGAPVFKIGYPKEEKRVKRDCDTYTANGAPYTKTGSVSTQIGGYICDSTSTLTIMNEVSVSETTTFSTTVGDPFGIASATVGFEFEKSASQSYGYEFTPADGQCGHVSFTPFYICSSGTITGCEGGDQNGEVCTAKRISDNQIDGAYSFVQTQ